MSDSSLASQIMTLLADSGYVSELSATDEDGYEHRIDFKNSYQFGAIYTHHGKIVNIESSQPQNKITNQK